MALHTSRIRVPVGHRRYDAAVLPTLSESAHRELRAHARGAKHRISFTVSSHDATLRQEQHKLHIPLPVAVARKDLSQLLLTKFESPAITNAVATDTVVPFQSPVTLSERLTLQVKVTDISGATTTTATVTLPPTLCAMTSVGGGVFAPADGGGHGLAVQGFSRCLVNTDVRGDGAVQVAAGSATNVELVTGTPTVTSNVFLFTAPRTAVDVVDAMLRQACATSSVSLGVQVMPRRNGDILLFRRGAHAIRTVQFEWSSPTVCAALGISTTFTVPEGNMDSGLRRPTAFTSLQLPPGIGAPALVASSLGAGTGLVLDAPLDSAVTVVNSFGVAVPLTWPVGSFSVHTAAATFNALADAALQAVQSGTTSFVHATVTAQSDGQHWHVQFASTDGGAFQIAFATDALANLFGFARTHVASCGAAAHSTLTLPRTRVHLSASLDARRGHIVITPRVQQAVSVASLAGGLASTRVFRSNAWHDARHRLQVGDVVEVRTLGEGQPYLLRVSAVDAASSQVATDVPAGVSLGTACAIQPALEAAQATVRWLFGPRTLSATQTSADRVLGLDPLLPFADLLFAGGELPLRANAHPSSDLLVTLENSGSLKAMPTHYVRALDGTVKSVLAEVTIDRVTSHMETRMLEAGMLVTGSTDTLEIGLCDAGSLRPSPLLAMDLRVTLTVVLA